MTEGEYNRRVISDTLARLKDEWLNPTLLQSVGEFAGGYCNIAIKVCGETRPAHIHIAPDFETFKIHLGEKKKANISTYRWRKP